MQKIYWEALEYFTNQLMTTKIYESLGNKTPLAYQREDRGHTEDTMLRYRVGWTDCELHEHL